jgi:hypothetical protein
MRSRLQVVSMVMVRERYGDDDDGDGGGGATVPLSLDEMDLRSMCDLFGGVSLFAAALLEITYWCVHKVAWVDLTEVVKEICPRGK